MIISIPDSEKKTFGELKKYLLTPKNNVTLKDDINEFLRRITLSILGKKKIVDIKNNSDFINVLPDNKITRRFIVFLINNYSNYTLSEIKTNINQYIEDFYRYNCIYPNIIDIIDNILLIDRINE